MAETQRPSVYVHLLPALIPPGALRGGVAVVVDVLRATSVMVRALASGCEAIVPCAEIEEAKDVAASLPAGSVLLAGERTGLPIPGFDLGNSPGDFTPEVCRGKTLVMTTTNGTRAILASREAEQVGIAALTNAEAAARWAGASGCDVHIVCAGTDGEISLEDTLAAGEIVHLLLQNPAYSLLAANDSARIAYHYFRGAAEQVDPNRGLTWAGVLAQGRGGRRVREIGLQKDIEAAGRLNAFDLVPVLRGDPPRIVRA